MKKKVLVLSFFPHPAYYVHMSISNYKKREIFQAMGNAVRRNMVAELMHGHKLGAADFAAGFDMTISGAMWHLQILEDVGLITRYKVHNRNLCRLNADVLSDIADWPAIMAPVGLIRLRLSLQYFIMIRKSA